MNISRKTQMTLIADVFPKVQITKKVIREMPKTSHFRGAFDKQYGKRAQTLLQSGRQYLYHIYWSMRRWVSWKKSLLVLCKILRLFVNTLTTDDKYSLLNRDNLTQPIQIMLSQKQKSFCPFFSTFSKSILNFEHSLKKRWP